MGKICDGCFYQEHRYDGVPICQHIQSMRVLEVVAEYIMCDVIKECEYYSSKTEVNTWIY